ncbi:MAG: methylenetetrahydrofolate reductase, partial [Gammaproteobacteria bacterium]|nr:methylenetetrahydrofolate reductase [Gammaproteobacteria bacterium]
MAAMAPQFSVEFFPPRTEAGRGKLDQVHEELTTLGVNSFSVTYGAGGSTKEGTRSIVLDYNAAGSEVAPHLSSTGQDLDVVGDLLNDYRDAGIRRLVALRGDTPPGQKRASKGFYARDLVEFVRRHTGDHFHI